MKTLDEVIYWYENRKSLLIGKATRDEMEEDILYYLKMYRSDMQMYSENQKYWEDELKEKIKDFGDAKERYIKRLKELDIGTLNEPLTWSELQHMDGKPVWVTFDNENGTWYIAKVYDDEVVLYEWGQEFGERISGAWDYTPKRWQAYRKERTDAR